MKITKVNGARIGVINTSVDKTGVTIYWVNGDKSNKNIKNVVEERIKNANNRYSVFFNGTQINGETVKKLPNGLEKVFSELMKKMELQYKEDIVAAYIDGSKEKCIQKQIEWLKLVADVKNTKKENETQKTYKVDFSELKWEPVDEEVLEKSLLRVRKSLKRGSDRWIIKRIIIALSRGSQEEYLKEIQDLEVGHKAKLEYFIDSVNKDYHKTNLLKSLKKHNVKVQVNKNVLPKELKEKYAWLMWEVENRFKKKILEYYKDREKNKEEISKLVKDQLGNLIGVKEIQKVEWGFTNHKYISKQSVSFEALEDCYICNSMLENMEIPLVDELKKDENNEVVKSFIKAMASGTKEEYNKRIKEYRTNNSEKFENYMDSLNGYYYLLWKNKSIYKKKPSTWMYGAENEGKKESILNLASIFNHRSNKNTLTGILEKYASSEQDANEILLELKKVFMEYFFVWDKDKFDDFLKQENLWKIPSEKIQSEGYFDEGFQAAEEYLAAEQQKAPKTMEELIAETEDGEVKIRWGAVRTRVRFVNCGKYLQMMNEDRNEREKFWITYVKEYIDENYVDVGKEKKTNNKKNKKELYQKISMFKECWSDAINYLCGKYMDIGKAVYHFAMPENISLEEKEYGVVREEYQKGISSFDYETIKAEETLQRNIATTTVAALAAFSRSVTDIDYSGKDILFTQDKDTVIKEDALRQILRYFGGISSVAGVFEQTKTDEEIASQLVSEIKSHFNLLRNENFHYTAGKIGAFSCDNVLKLWENDQKVYGQIVRQKYYSNNVSMFYGTDIIQELVAEFYGEKAADRQINVSQATAFKNVLHKKDLFSFIDKIINKKSEGWKKISTGADGSIRVKYEGSLYFLLKEIYYNEFVCSTKACDYFYKAVETYNGTEGVKNSKEAAENFKSYVSELKNENLNFGQICQRITQEYNQQNTRREEENYKHFKMLLPLCIRQAFENYLILEKQNDLTGMKKYAWLRTPGYIEAEGVKTYLDKTTIKCRVSIKGEVNEPDEKRRIAWYTFAHFVHPKQLNLLIGDFKSYIQYREDIIRRAGYAKQYGNKDAGKKMKASIKWAKLVLEVLEFVRVLSGRGTGNFCDYYKDADEYSRYLSRYIDFSQSKEPTFEELKTFCQNLNIQNDKFDILLDEQNPKMVSNIEYARMYGGGDVAFKGFKKIRKEEIEEYYREKNSNTLVMPNDLCETEEEKKKVIRQQQLKGRILLNEVMDSFSIINDMMGRLVSLAYLRERDKMYLLLGYYYMALRNRDNASMDSLNVTITQQNKENRTIVIEKGAILYQLVGVFDYGTPALLYENNEWILHTGYSIGKRESLFTAQYKVSKTCAMQLFQNVKEENGKGNKNKGKDSDKKNPPKMHWETIRDLRNSVDHLKYYRNPEQSIWELYSEFYQKFFGYSKKLRKSVLTNFCNVLEDYDLKAEITFDSERKPKLGNITSTKFTYKLNSFDEKGKQKTCDIDAKSETFCDNIKAVLEYSTTDTSSK